MTFPSVSRVSRVDRAMHGPPAPMKRLRFLACAAAIATCAACSTESGPATATADGGDPDSATPDVVDPPPQPCTTGADCPAASPCCLRDDDGGGGHCAADPGTAQACLCEKSSDCVASACAPALDESGNPTGPYVCVPNSGYPYRGCMGNPSLCGVPYCCVKDKNGNQFCAMPCETDSECGPAHCDAFDFSQAVYCNGGRAACAP